MISREEAFALVSERIPNRNLVNHCVATEVIMGALAQHLGKCAEEVEAWERAGLLHDLDYAETAEDFERHGLVTVEELGDRVDPRIAHAILAHAEKAPLESDLDIALYAADPATGFIVATALVRPDKSLAGVEVRSLKKRWKEKAFARGASRDQMSAHERLGLSRDEFLGISLTAMQEHAGELGL
ncbi:MAG: HDIG domain-containing protein [Coriobacteriales bacterium]|nr:HDIG domain-containing protein [Coriobacteriales bacterium]